MRNSRLVQLLVVAALLVVPVAAISAQSGTANSGYVWDGASDWPGVTCIALPEALPETGIARFDSYTEDDRALLAIQPWGKVAPQALPETGSDKIPAPAIANWRFEGFTLVPDFADTAKPSALPATGNTAPDGMTIQGFTWDGQAYVPNVVSEPPAALPQSGMDFGGLSGRDRQVILDQMAARGASAWSAPASTQRTANLDGITGRERQTIIDHLAASGVTVTTAQPAALPETGASGAGLGSPSDPPLIGDWTQAAEPVARQDASISDPPLLDMFNR